MDPSISLRVGRHGWLGTDVLNPHVPKVPQNQADVPPFSSGSVKICLPARDRPRLHGARAAKPAIPREAHPHQREHQIELSNSPARSSEKARPTLTKLTPTSHPRCISAHDLIAQPNGPLLSKQCLQIRLRRACAAGRVIIFASLTERLRLRQVCTRLAFSAPRAF